MLLIPPILSRCYNSRNASEWHERHSLPIVDSIIFTQKCWSVNLYAFLFHPHSLAVHSGPPTPSWLTIHEASPPVTQIELTTISSCPVHRKREGEGAVEWIHTKDGDNIESKPTWEQQDLNGNKMPIADSGSGGGVPSSVHTSQGTQENICGGIQTKHTFKVA